MPPHSGRTYTSNPVKSRDVFVSEERSVVVYVDPEAGSDKDPGTSTLPVRTINRALLLMRAKRSSTKEKGTIYLRPGHYFPTKPISVTAEDSNLSIIGYGQDKTFISGAKNYSFDWSTYLSKMEPMAVDVSIVKGSIPSPGESNNQAKFFAKLSNASDCQLACEKDSSCFAFTWYDSSFGDLANMCYFRADGLWVQSSVTGAISGRKLYILLADLSDQDPTPFTTLFLNGRRAVRARYPDGNPETMGLHTDPTGYTHAMKWLPHVEKPPADEIHIDSPQRNGTHFPHFLIGVGGPVDVFDPPESYWGTSAPVGGGGSTYRITTGLEYSNYEDFVKRTWQNPKTGVVHAFHCHYWGNWQFAIDDRDEATTTIRWSYGGFQEARGCDFGQEWFVENIFEELDAPGEWFYDQVGKKLYLYPNITDGDVPSSGFGTMLKRLFNIRGTINRPVYNITLMNITFMHTEPTFLDSYEVPSGGDWAIHRDGAVFVEGVDGVTVEQCLFDSPGGNGLFLSNYVRNAVIEANEFRYSGDSSIAVIGSTDLIDGTNGNQPRGTKVISNLIHENGIFGKQTSPYVQSLACQTELVGNVIFNGPRAGINFNDGFGGGNFLKNNLIFNMVRETGDHGPFNSWDRQPYLTEVLDGVLPSLTPATSYINQNFIINNYHSTWPIDHDDGSCYYEDTYNYLVYGGYKNFLGHSKTVMYNAYIYPDGIHTEKQTYRRYPYCANHDGATVTVLPSGWGEVWANNRCIIGNPDIYSFDACDVNGDLKKGLVPFTYNNTFYAPNRDVYIGCGNVNLTLAEYQAMGFDIGSVVNDVVDIGTVVDWGRQLLGL